MHYFESLQVELHKHFWSSNFRAEASDAVSILTALHGNLQIFELTRSGFKIQQDYRKTAGALTYIHVGYPVCNMLSSIISMFSHPWLDGTQSAQMQANASSSYSSRDPKMSSCYKFNVQILNNGSYTVLTQDSANSSISLNNSVSHAELWATCGNKIVSSRKWWESYNMLGSWKNPHSTSRIRILIISTGCITCSYQMNQYCKGPSLSLQQDLAKHVHIIVNPSVLQRQCCFTSTAVSTTKSDLKRCKDVVSPVLGQTKLDLLISSIQTKTCKTQVLLTIMSKRISDVQCQVAFSVRQCAMIASYPLSGSCFRTLLAKESANLRMVNSVRQTVHEQTHQVSLCAPLHSYNYQQAALHQHSNVIQVQMEWCLRPCIQWPPHKEICQSPPLQEHKE